MNITYTDKEQVEDYDPSLWNAQDANEIKNAVNSKADKTELANKADVSALSGKADKVNGVVPLSQLPDAVLNINQFEVLSDGTIGIRTSYLQSLGLSTGGGGTNPNPSDPNTTPSAPTLSADDSSNILIASHALGNSEIVMSVNGSAYVQYTGAIAVGDIARAAGYWKFKVKAATGRNESAVVNSPEFTVAPVGNTTPSAPSNGVVNDTQNTFSFTLVSGIALSGNYEYTLNGGTTVANVTSNPISVGNLAFGVNQVGVRVKAATGRNASAWLFNTSAFTVASAAPSNAVPLTVFPQLVNVVADGNNLTFNSTNEYSVAYTGKKVPAGASAIIMADVLTTHTAWIVADESETVRALYQTDYVLYVGESTDGKKVASSVKGSGGDNWSKELLGSPNSKIRMRIDATNVYFEYTSNNGVTWLEQGKATRTGVDLYVRFVGDVNKTRVLENIMVEGLV